MPRHVAPHSRPRRTEPRVSLTAAHLPQTPPRFAASLAVNIISPKPIIFLGKGGQFSLHDARNRDQGIRQGGPADLKVIDLPDPTPKADEYLIQVQAAAANFFDILQVQGKYQNQPRTFFSLPSAPFPFLIFHVHSFIPHILRIRKGTR
ncbi:hypothetical protein VFPBJ_08640 [Purpureocillium lilacinum]|uniref:Uncharacterized protein n=1 Tax=Purpureocillium lilacinum TaxID=33203 RepID=A0A179GFP5_PURLI|nr:hypothetical protein VFPBJ_08640 [Purpureocillium lilacinum]